MNLFDALANYDYEAMINIYAKNGLDSLESMSRHAHNSSLPFSLKSGMFKIISI